MISAQTPLAFVAREHRFPLFRTMLKKEKRGYYGLKGALRRAAAFRRPANGCPQRNLHAKSFATPRQNRGVAASRRRVGLVQHQGERHIRFRPSRHAGRLPAENPRPQSAGGKEEILRAGTEAGSLRETPSWRSPQVRSESTTITGWSCASR